ncbi:MAG: DEAD/DEAH box helicase, partial [Spirochaetaceae bacterium]|nr:DEAD/DEAH box helicase [Spirochaetaceae bacterium]
MKFEECGFNENLLKGISEAGYVDCTEVQEKVIRYFTEKKGDLYVQSQTGTGKTAAYLIPILNECLKDRENSQILIMTPTREL